MAPRGEFSKGALGIKKLKKKAFIYFSKIFQLHSNIVWHASTEHEKKDIEYVFGKGLDIRIAKNISQNLNFDRFAADGNELIKRRNEIRLVSLSRISKMKNINLALQILQGVNGSIVFDIYGPMEDWIYWEDCLHLIDSHGDNIKISYRGEIRHSEVNKILKEYHFFYLLTKGENYGHAIAEALQAGRPLLISNNTPWRGLEAKGVGWDLDLTDIYHIRQILQKCVAMEQEEYTSMSQKAYFFAREFCNDSKNIQDNISVFSI